MGWRRRTFLFEADGGTLRHLPQRVDRGLFEGRDRIPQYAGRTLRVMTVSLETDGQTPLPIRWFDTSVWRFDDDGRLDVRWLISPAPEHAYREAREQAVEADIVELPSILEAKQARDEHWGIGEHDQPL